jgi:hypothetical protein
MVVLFDKPAPSIPRQSPSPHPPPPLPPVFTDSPHRLHSPQPDPPVDPRTLAAVRLRATPSRRQRPKELVSKINILDLPTETTATIFRYAHKPKDFHFLLPSGAGPLIPRAYNLPLTVSKEWYRRVMPIYYETLRLTWLRVPEFVENVQRYPESMGRYINSIHVRITGKSFYKVVKAEGSGGGRKQFPQGGEDPHPTTSKLSTAQLYLLIGQYIDTPLATFALCLNSLACLKDLTLRFTDCKGGEVSLQSLVSLFLLS